uniref:MMS1_N domain-containing protein n=1 Tax=Mesocestoides corti TaxID=53468 RepID=A0A5K3FWX8_MESCO
MTGVHKHEYEQGGTTCDHGGCLAIAAHCQHLITPDDPFDVSGLCSNLHELHCADVHRDGILHFVTVRSHLITHIRQFELSDVNVLEGALELQVVTSVFHSGDSGGGFWRVADSAIMHSTSIPHKVELPAPSNVHLLPCGVLIATTAFLKLHWDATCVRTQGERITLRT